MILLVFFFFFLIFHRLKKKKCSEFKSPISWASVHKRVRLRALPSGRCWPDAHTMYFSELKRTSATVRSGLVRSDGGWRMEWRTRRLHRTRGAVLPRARRSRHEARCPRGRADPSKRAGDRRSGGRRNGHRQRQRPHPGPRGEREFSRDADHLRF